MATQTKEDIAMAQLIDAIELYNRARYVSAITLSGASEEIFAQLLKQESKEKDVPLATAEEIEQFLFESWPELITAKNYHIQRSQIRNELKHHGDKRTHNPVTNDFAYTALLHIAGAIINYKMAKGALPVDQSIQQFCDTHGIN